jgi:hypothetical protein
MRRAMLHVRGFPGDQVPEILTEDGSSFAMPPAFSRKSPGDKGCETGPVFSYNRTW